MEETKKNEETFDLEPVTTDLEPTSEETKEHSKGGVILLGALIGGAAFGVWTLYKKRKKKKNIEVEDADFEECYDEDDEDVVDEQPEAKEEKKNTEKK